MNKKLTLHIFSLSLLLAGTFLLTPLAKVQAQESVPLQVSPARQELVVDPGDTQTVTVNFFNYGQTPIEGTVHVVDFTVSGRDGKPRLIDNIEEASPRFAASQWVELPFERLTIASEGKVTIQAKISIPSDALPGGRYLSFYFEPTGQLPQFDSQDDAEAGSAISSRIGSLVFMRVSGPITEKALISGLFVPSFTENGPISIDAEILNRGDYHIRPRGNVSLTNMFGARVDQIKLDEENVFPDASRVYSTKLGNKWMIGKYSVSISASYGETGQVINRSIDVWVFPWKVALIVALAIIIVILLMKQFFDKLITRESQMMKKIKEENQQIEELREQLKKKEQ